MKSNNKHWNQLEHHVQKALAERKTAFSIKDTNEFPLAFNTKMPNGFGYEKGHISFLFKDFTCSGLDNMQLIKNKSVKKDGKKYIHLCLDNLKVKGHYEIKSKYAPSIDIDTAGSMLNYQDESLAKMAGADSADGTKITPTEAEGYLDNAREQRTRLMNQPNGQKIMASYNEHNEVYNEVFVKSAATRTTWNAQGATAEMAKHTNDATASKNNDIIINSNDKLYAGGVTYDSNAFVQKLNIVVNTISTDPKFNPWDPNAKPNPDSKYTKASLAALSFGKAVKTTQKIDKNNPKKITGDEIPEFTSEGVYTYINDFSGTPPEATGAELENIIKQGMSGGGADEAAENNWYILNEEQRKMVRRWIHENALEQEFDKNNISQTFLEGDCYSSIDNVEVQIEIDLEAKQGTLPNIDVVLPVFEFDIDDSHWTGKIASVLRERLSHIYFIKSLIHHQIEAGIKKIVETEVVKLVQ
ncbi:hypothetical protein [uncultured Algibacter sp.]|uniref:hypothetical protein n=1 Tax=uncultured Algibacter sp. TaxID=298659 RepID=UPI0032162D9D